MTVIWKYALDAPRQVIHMPPGRILAVAWQHGNPTLWAEVDPEAPLRDTRHFRVVPTGYAFELAMDSRYIGSAISDDLVFHVYEEPA